MMMMMFKTGVYKEFQEIHDALARFPQLVMTSCGWGPAKDNDHAVVTEGECMAAKAALSKLQDLVDLLKAQDAAETSSTSSKDTQS